MKYENWINSFKALAPYKHLCVCVLVLLLSFINSIIQPMFVGWLNLVAWFLIWNLSKCLCMNVNMFVCANACICVSCSQLFWICRMNSFMHSCHSVFRFQIKHISTTRPSPCAMRKETAVVAAVFPAGIYDRRQQQERHKPTLTSASLNILRIFKFKCNCFSTCREIQASSNEWLKGSCSTIDHMPTSDVLRKSIRRSWTISSKFWIYFYVFFIYYIYFFFRSRGRSQQS